MTLENKIEKCFWKSIADKDTKKREENKDTRNVTLAETKPCYKCDGFNVNCFDYVRLGEIYA